MPARTLTTRNDAATPDSLGAAPSAPPQSRSERQTASGDLGSARLLDGGMVQGLRWFVGMGIATMVIVALFFGRDLLIPLALAILLGFLLDPAVTRLKRWGLPRMVATLLMVVLTLGALTGMGLYLGRQVQQLSADLPTYQHTIRDKLSRLRQFTQGPSMWDGALSTYNTVEKEISKSDASASTSAAGTPARVQKVEVVSAAEKPSQQALTWLARISEPIAMAGIVLLFVILILLDRDDLRDRLLRLLGGNLHLATDALDEASDRIGRYLRMQCIVNVSYGIPLGAALWFIGVPGAVLWGAVAAITRFVPYVGPMVSAIFPLALAFAVDPGWNMLLWTLGVIVVLELISNNVIEPWLYGASTGLSTLAIILAATFWTALWGPIGLILSTPLTVCLFVLGRYLPGLGFMEVLLGSAPVLDAPRRLYQRLLADDVDDAITLAHKEIESHLPSRPEATDRLAAVHRFYDTVALPTLQLASSQYNTSSATAEHRLRLSQGMDALIDEMIEQYPAQVHAVPPSTPQRIHCIGARWDIDSMGAALAAHGLALDGQNVSFSEYPLGSGRHVSTTEDRQQVQWLLLSVFHPQPAALVRQTCRRLHRQFPDLRIVVGLWNAIEPLALESLSDWGVVAVVVSLQEWRLRMQTLLAPPSEQTHYIPAPVNPGDDERVQHLQQSGALAAHWEPVYHEAALKAANAFDVRYAQISLVDHDWVHTPGSLIPQAKAPLSPDGSPPRPGVPRDQSICSYVVQAQAPLVVEDIARDPRFADNPAVQAQSLRFYAGVPLTDDDGSVLGSLCLLHDAPRSMSEDDLALLHTMAEALVRELHADPPAIAPPSVTPATPSQQDHPGTQIPR